jgi:two-component system, OmpR family, response regulator CpxR
MRLASRGAASQIFAKLILAATRRDSNLVMRIRSIVEAGAPASAWPALQAVPGGVNRDETARERRARRRDWKWMDVELCTLMREFFAAHDFAIEVRHDGDAGLGEALAGRFDLILLDVMMPKLDGFSLLQRLRAKSNVPVLMLTARTEQQNRIKGLESGADDYLPKPFDPLELLARVRAILRRSQAKPNAVSAALQVGGIRIDPSARSVVKHGVPVEITSVEYEVLELLASSAGRVVSRDELMQRLYQREATPFDRAIDVHISHLRKKLEQGGVCIKTVRGVGYQFCAEGGAQANR